MRKPNSTTIRHTFDGGFATDYGKVVSSPVLVGSTVSVPYLLDAKDCIFNLDGGPRKIGGTDKLNSSVLSSGSPVIGLYEFWNQVVGQQRIAYAGSTIYVDNADGNFTPIFTGVVGDAVMCFSQFDDLLVITTDQGDLPRSWDGTTAQFLAGSPPALTVTAVHKNRLWGAKGSTVYGTAADDPTDWTGTGSVQFSVSAGDGDDVTALISYKKELWIFKGPHKGSIHRLSGSGPTSDVDPFSLDPFLEEGLGAVHQNSITKFRDDLCFLWSDGSFHSLTSTASFGDFNDASLSRPFNNYLYDNVSASGLRRAYAVNHGSSGRVWLTMRVSSPTSNNIIFLMDYRFDPVRWTYITAYNAQSLALVHDVSTRGLPMVMVGGSDGYVRRTQLATKSVDGVGALNYKVQTPFLNYGIPIKKKTLSNIGIGIDPTGDALATIGWRRDAEALQTATVVQGGGDVLGPASAHAFTLGTSTLGGSSYADKWVDTIDGGEFRSIQYEITQPTVGEDINLHYINSTIDVGSESLENT